MLLLSVLALSKLIPSPPGEEVRAELAEGLAAIEDDAQMFCPLGPNVDTTFGPCARVAA